MIHLNPSTESTQGHRESGGFTYQAYPTYLTGSGTGAPTSR